MVNLPVYNLEGNEVTTVLASDDVFASSNSLGVVHQALVWYQAGKRAGTASTKTRAEVSGGGKKPWNQKGTGRARAGSIRSPLWNGGGVTFGPKPRDYSFKLSKNARKAALKVVLSDRAREKAIKIVDDLKIASGKTREAAKVLAPFIKEVSSLLIVVNNPDDSLTRAVKNLVGVKLVSVETVNIFDLLNASGILITKEALINLQERIEKKQ